MGTERPSHFEADNFEIGNPIKNYQDREDFVKMLEAMGSKMDGLSKEDKAVWTTFIDSALGIKNFQEARNFVEKLLNAFSDKDRKSGQRMAKQSVNELAIGIACGPRALRLKDRKTVMRISDFLVRHGVIVFNDEGRIEVSKAA